MMLACPICAAQNHFIMDQRPYVPVAQNLVWPDRASAQRAPAGRLEMMLCKTCHFAWNSDFEPERMVYDPLYDNDQLKSPSFSRHVDSMVQRIIDKLDGVSEYHLVEVGCGQGELLKKLQKTNRFASLTGFDPAFRGGPLPSLTKIHSHLFNRDALGLLEHPINIVVSRHTIEHIHRPLDFLSTIRATLDDKRPSLIFLETPDIGWIIENFQPHDLFYEHCSIFSNYALYHACVQAGFEVQAIVPVFKGQYLWAELTTAGKPSSIAPTLSRLTATEQFGTQRSAFVAHWRNQVALLRKSGQVWLWGAASKGVTFALLVDPDGSQLAGAIDINDRKIGKFMPLTGLPICPPERLADLDSVIVMNPNYRLEIQDKIVTLGKSIRLLTLDACSLEMTL